ncbi:hypothetical protein [Dongia deserti]|uniref:hypothetical protein n=1 Tax=Dongia deserti TaxID=2268030 RepID=UPI0013C501FD|nr:hypothetical protein [Dongia deserti]
MEYHLDRRVVLSPVSKLSNLYTWSLQEFDAAGKQIGSDQMPWGWTLYFTVSELRLIDVTTYEASEDEIEKKGLHGKQVIRAKLNAGVPWDRHGDYKTRYSMFGTDRIISDFELSIEKLPAGKEEETCRAWGSVSYTTDHDFRDETTDDTVLFHLLVRPETFDKYAGKITAGQLTEATFRVGRVHGFYSEWSPSITTNSVKVLTRDAKYHKVEIPDGCQIDPNRLGQVGEAELTLVRKIKFAKAPQPVEEDYDEAITERVVSDGQPPQPVVIADARLVKLLSSLRIAVWVVAGLLLGILLSLKW